MPDDVEDALKAAIADFSASFQPTEAVGSAEGAGPGTPADEVKTDVGWDRISSVDEDDAGTEAPAEEGEADAPASE